VMWQLHPQSSGSGWKTSTFVTYEAVTEDGPSSRAFDARRAIEAAHFVRYR
jgi:hypothetical protein